MEKPGGQMPSQFPALRLTVAGQMAAYRDRIAQRIREEATRHGESAPDLAHALGVYPTTAERWFRGDRTPQPRFRRELAKHWGIPFEELEPDLAAEEKKLRAQLDRIEEKLDQVLDHLEAAAAERELDDEERDQSDPPDAEEGGATGT